MTTEAELQGLLDAKDDRSIRILPNGSICDCAAAADGPWADVHTRDCASLQFTEQKIAKIIFEQMNNCTIRDPNSQFTEGSRPMRAARAVIAVLRPQR